MPPQNRRAQDEASLVASTARGIVIAALEGFGNRLSHSHKEALTELTHDLSRLAFGLLTGRYAFPLNCGLGKTQSVIAFCAALHRLGHTDKSVAVSASKVEALCEMKRCMIDAGIPEEKIGLLHSYKFDPDRIGDEGYASLPSTADNDDRQFSLCTHNRIRGSAALSTFYHYQGGLRSLLVWDESLITSDARALDFITLEGALGWVAPRLRLKKRHEVTAYLRAATEAIGAELDRQQAQPGSKASPVILGEIDGITVGKYKDALGGNANVKPLRQLLDMSAHPLRCVYTTHMSGAGLVTYDVAVPEALTSVAILDGSYPIRDLERLDQSIQSGMHVDRDIKLHEHVVLHHMKAPSGRAAMTKDFTNDKLVVAEVIDVIKTIPLTEAVIIWTFKPRKEYGKRGRSLIVDFAAVIKNALREVGVDTEAVVDAKPRLIFQTWGSETSSSQFSYASNMIFAGVLHRNMLDLAANLVGQKGNLWAMVDHTELRRILNSEIAHSVYQALCRGSCRTMVDNQAKAMKAWIMHSDDGSLRLALDEVMPGMKWCNWEPQHLKTSATDGPRGRHVRLIKAYLDALEQTVQSISIQRMRADLGVTPKAATFSRAVGDYLEAYPMWEKKGRTLHRETWDWQNTQ